MRYTAQATALAASFCSSALMVCSSAIAWWGGSEANTACGQIGPDIMPAEIPSIIGYTAEQIDDVFYDAFSAAHTICNIGDANVPFDFFPSNNHPVFVQNLYKLKDGRIEQIGMSWVKHGFAALAQNLCQCGCNGQSTTVLGAGCSDPETASITGSQQGLSPRFQINAHTGFFPTPAPANPPFSGTTARRLRVKSADLEPSSAQVQYVLEWVYVSAADAGAGNQNNNASYRPVVISAGTGEGNFNAAMTGQTVRGTAGIRAWKASDASVIETEIQLPNEGLYILAAKARDLGNGMWRYDYALENVNSDVAGASFSVPVPAGAKVSNIGFHDVDYHSLDGIPLPDGPDPDTQPDWRNFDGTDWAVTQTPEQIVWETETFAQNDNANALRWGTMYNFWFEVNRPPADEFGMITLGTFKVPGQVNALTIVPGPVATCAADISPSPQGNGAVDVDDLILVINNWGALGGVADIAPPPAGNGIVDVDDLLAVINSWGPCE